MSIWETIKMAFAALFEDVEPCERDSEDYCDECGELIHEGEDRLKTQGRIVCVQCAHGPF